MDLDNFLKTMTEEVSSMRVSELSREEEQLPGFEAHKAKLFIRFSALGCRDKIEKLRIQQAIAAVNKEAKNQEKTVLNPIQRQQLFYVVLATAGVLIAYRILR